MDIVTRAEWGARPPAGTIKTVAPAARDEYFQHWNGGATRIANHDRCPGVVRQIQGYHIDGRGWVDIGYNLLVCPHGTVYEGRGIDAVGAHCVDHNRSGYGVQAMIGEGEHPTPAMLTTLAAVRAMLISRSGHTLALRGHRDGMSTTCPGDELYAWVHAGMTPPTPTTTPEEPDMTPAQAAQLADIAARIRGTAPDRDTLQYLTVMAEDTARQVAALAATVTALAAGAGTRLAVTGEMVLTPQAHQ